MTARKILCAVDFSQGSSVALHVAAEQARKIQAVLVLLHVYEVPTWTVRGEPPLGPDNLEQLRVERRTELATWQSEAARLGASEVRVECVGGTAWDQIVAVAADDPTIELIVVGSHGRTGIRRVVLGSVAERVVRHAPCSVLVARSRKLED